MEKEVYAQVKLNVKKLLDINLDYYKDEQMKRRLDSWLVRVGARSWPEYFKRMQTDEIELGRFRDYLTINVSAFFRDPERWQTLRQKVVPDLLESATQRERAKGVSLPVPHLRVWSAGCSIGMEPYSLSILFEELTPNRRHYLLATDLDRGALAKAKARRRAGGNINPGVFADGFRHRQPRPTWVKVQLYALIGDGASA